MHDFKKVLLATDFSRCAEIAFEYAYAMAKRCQAELILVHVMCEPVDLRGFYVPHITFDVLESEIEAGARAMMTEFCRGRLSDDDNYSTVIASGVPNEAILEQARQLGADVIVVGTHGRSGFDHLLFGSTAERVVRKSPIPVLTVRCAEQTEQDCAE